MTYKKGDKIGDYNVIQELGRGRMAVVYLVEDTKGHQYAIKVLHESFATDKRVQILKREAKINRRLFHPAIARVEGYKYFPPSHCLIMEYGEGSDLGEYLEKRKQLSIKDTLQIAWEICTALEHAHSLGIAHRDIKPQNIILGKGNKVKITDFGLASASTESIATLSIGTFTGTPHYISPEQANGEKGDKLSDLYSLGVIMYQMLTGKVPFEHDNLLVILDMHRNKPPKPILEIRSKVPSRLVGLVGKAMAKSPSDRFQSAKAMRHAVEEFAEEQGIELERRDILKPFWHHIGRVFFYWPITRWEDVVTNLGANVVWMTLTSIFVLVMGISLGTRYPTPAGGTPDKKG